MYCSLPTHHHHPTNKQTVVQTRLTDFWRQPQEEALQEQVAEQPQTNKRVNIIQLNVCSFTEIKATLISQLALEHDVSVLCLSEIGHKRAIPSFKCASTSDIHTQSGKFVHHDMGSGMAQWL